MCFTDNYKQCLKTNKIFHNINNVIVINSINKQYIYNKKEIYGEKINSGFKIYPINGKIFTINDSNIVKVEKMNND